MMSDEKKAFSLDESNILSKNEDNETFSPQDDSEISDLIKISELIDDGLFETEALTQSVMENNELPPRLQRTIEGVIDDVIYQATKNFKRRLREDLSYSLNQELSKYFKNK